MTPEQLREKMNSAKMLEIVQQQTNLTCDAYQQGWEDCWNMFTEMLKDKVERWHHLKSS